MSSVRLGAVGYLNARPLVYGLGASPQFALRFDVPSQCAELLHAGAIDVGLIPSIEYLRHPREPYAIVPDLAIASSGPVASVAIFTTRPMADVRSIALDTSSRTSVALVRVLCARVFGIRPALDPLGPDLREMLSRCDAALIIGDNALIQQGGEVELPAGSGDRQRAANVSIEKIDLGEVWIRATGLPFVYAFWAGRAGCLSPAHVQALHRARDLGLQRTEEIARDYFKDAPDRWSMGARYLRDNIKYSLGVQERAGLDLFYRYAIEAGVVEGAEPLRFY
jgi:chorismate dehydratase